MAGALHEAAGGWRLEPTLRHASMYSTIVYVFGKNNSNFKKKVEKK